MISFIKICLSLVVTLGSMITLPTVMLASEQNSVERAAKESIMNGVIVNDVTLAPLRQFSELLGAKVEWDAETRGITVIKENTTIAMTINEKKASINQSSVPLETAPQLIRERTMVPVRFISEALGVTVVWNEELRLVSVEDKIKILIEPDAVTARKLFDEAISSLKDLVSNDITALEQKYGWGYPREEGEVLYASHKSELNKYFSTRFINDDLLTYYLMYIHQWDGWSIAGDPDVRFNVNFIDDTRFQVQTVYSTMADTNAIVDYYFVRENGKWLMDDVEKEDLYLINETGDGQYLNDSFNMNLNQEEAERIASYGDVKILRSYGLIEMNENNNNRGLTGQYYVFVTSQEGLTINQRTGETMFYEPSEPLIFGSNAPRMSVSDAKELALEFIEKRFSAVVRSDLEYNFNVNTGDYEVWVGGGAAYFNLCTVDGNTGEVTLVDGSLHYGSRGQNTKDIIEMPSK